MHIVYGTEQPFPLARADTHQIVSTIAALGRRGVDVELLIPDLLGEVSADELCDFYAVSGSFRVRQVPGALKRVHAAHKIEHSLRVCLDSEAKRADVVYTRSLGTVLSCLSSGTRVVLDAYRPWPAQYPALKYPLRAMFSHPRFLGVLLHSDFARQCYLNAGFPEKKLVLARNGHEPSNFQPRLDRGQARTKLGLPLEADIALYAGNVNGKKGLDVVLDMARIMPETMFVLVGSKGHGELEQAAARVDNVTVIPHQGPEQLAAYLYAADVLLIPPSSEPLTRFHNTVLPIKLYTYLAAGRAILAPRAPDTAELLEHDRNAVLVDPGNARRAASALRALLDDDERRQRLAAAALQLGQTLTWDRRAEVIHRFLASA